MYLSIQKVIFNYYSVRHGTPETQKSRKLPNSLIAKLPLRKRNLLHSRKYFSSRCYFFFLAFDTQFRKKYEAQEGKQNLKCYRSRFRESNEFLAARFGRQSKRPVNTFSSLFAHVCIRSTFSQSSLLLVSRNYNNSVKIIGSIVCYFHLWNEC